MKGTIECPHCHIKTNDPSVIYGMMRVFNTFTDEVTLGCPSCGEDIETYRYDEYYQILEKAQADKKEVLSTRLKVHQLLVNTAFNTGDRKWMICLEKEFYELVEEVKELEKRQFLLFKQKGKGETSMNKKKIMGCDKI